MSSTRSISPHAPSNPATTLASGNTSRQSLSTLPGTGGSSLTRTATGSPTATGSTQNTAGTGTSLGGKSRTSLSSSSSTHSAESATPPESPADKDASTIGKAHNKVKAAYSKVKNWFVAEKDKDGKVTKESGIKRAWAKVGLGRAWRRIVSDSYGDFAVHGAF
jgi:hypothetical protein